MSTKVYKPIIYVLVLVLLPVFQIFASENNRNTKLNPGDLIIEHISDAHEWHITKIGNFDVVVPLPIILIDDGAIVTFMSSKFHHGTESYNGYIIAKEGKNKGKIVKVKSDGKDIDEEASVPLDFSITKNVLSIFIMVILLMIIFISVAKKYRKNPNKAPSGLQSLLEPLILFVRDNIAKECIGPKSEKFTPYLLTLFFFIFFMNIFGIIPIFPGGANVMGNITITMSLALITFIITTFIAKKPYWVDIVNTPGVPWWLKIPLPLMPIVETIGVITKPFVLMIRLFANMMAGHIVALGFFCLIFIFGAMNMYIGYGVSIVSVFFTIFLNLLELLVCFIQAYVFTVLSALYFGMAIADHHSEEAESISH